MEKLPMIVAWAEMADVGLWGFVGFMSMGLAGWLHTKEKDYPGSAQAGTALILVGFAMWGWALLGELPEALKALAWAYS
ncbi:hypothetical protein LCGC14_0472110 [marine sediment metagenome]|uniref:Uncharacterized protein n=1 Tax=marine sediment metagenome TaxID=412755 RepID=A0A0F9SH69_9ZZZZ